MDLRDYWRIIRRQWKWSVSVFVLMLAIFVSYGHFVEQTHYRAFFQVGIRTPTKDEQIFRETSYLVPPVAYNIPTKVELLNRESLQTAGARRLYCALRLAEGAIGGAPVEEAFGRLAEAQEPGTTDEAFWSTVEEVLQKEGLAPGAGSVVRKTEDLFRKALEETVGVIVANYRRQKDPRLVFGDEIAEVARAKGLKPKATKGKDHEIFLLSQIESIPDPAKRREALREIKARLEALIPEPTREVQERSQLVNLSVTYPGGPESVVLANVFAMSAVDKDLEETRKQREAEEAAVRKHIVEAEKKIEDKRDEIERFQQANQIHELEKDLGGTWQEMQRLGEEIRLKAAERMRLEHEIQAPPPAPLLSGGVREDTPRLAKARDALNHLESERARMLLDLKDEHPEVKRIQAQIEQARLQLDQETRREEERLQQEHLDRIAGLHDRLRVIADEAAQLERSLADAQVRYKDLSRKRFLNNDLFEALRHATDQRNKLHERLAAISLYKDAFLQNPENITGTLKIERYARESNPLPKRTQDALGLMFILSAVVAIAIAYLAEYSDTRIRTEQDVRKHLNMPVLAKIERRNRGEKVCLTELKPSDPFAEVFNTVSTVIVSAARDLGLKMFTVSSTVPEEGKTTITVNLGVALARKGLRVILVDGDMRRPQLHDMLGVDNSTGLSTILEGRAIAMEGLGEITGEPTVAQGVEAFLKPTPVENLRLLPSGPTPPDPVTLLESQRMKDLLQELRQTADFILIDTPPIFHVGDVLTLSPQVDANLFVVGAFEVKQHEVAWAKHLLSNVEANTLGAFLNKEVVESKSYYYYYRYYKGYRYRN